MSDPAGSDRAALLAILHIGHDVSMRGAGKSLTQAVADTHYRRLRHGLSADRLVPVVTENPALVTEWLRYSEDKRTGGWYLLEGGEIGNLEMQTKELIQPISRAVAEYVLRELDFWCAVEDKAKPRVS